jgi:hypothetical protein
MCSRSTRQDSHGNSSEEYRNDATDKFPDTWSLAHAIRRAKSAGSPDLYSDEAIAQ